MCLIIIFNFTSGISHAKGNSEESAKKDGHSEVQNKNGSENKKHDTNTKENKASGNTKDGDVQMKKAKKSDN